MTDKVQATEALIRGFISSEVQHTIRGAMVKPEEAAETKEDKEEKSTEEE